MKLCTLYKKSSKGVIQQWTIRVIDDECGAGVIETVHGQVGGKLQTTTDTITEGKNLGKANETSPLDQAHAEAQAKWEKQKKKGYVETKAAAEAGELDALIEGGINPMLAHPYSKQAHKVKYPCFGQPKLDGIRCIAILEDGMCTLWSRTRKLITGVPHVARAVEKKFKGYEITLDGELYNHDFKKDFEQIVSFVRQETPAEGHEVVQYHVYDVVNDQKFQDRKAFLGDFFAETEQQKTIVLVDTFHVAVEEDVDNDFQAAIKRGYEGLMLRNSEGLYANKRSVDLQKVKEFEDSEFDIVGIEEGRGKLQGHAIFKCKTKEGSEFLAKMKGETSKLKEYFDNHKLWLGKKLTVQYQGLTGREKVPRFPVGVAIRDYE